MPGLKFKKLTIDDRELIQKFTGQFPPYSDFNFLSMLTYNTGESLEYAFHNNNLIIKFEDYITGENFYSVLGKTGIRETKKLVLERAASEGLQNSLGLVPHSSVMSDPEIENLFEVVEDRDNFDYIVSSTEVARLSKDKFPKKHRAVGRFMAHYPEVRVRRIDLSNKKTQNSVLELFEHWQKGGHKTDKESGIELKAIKRLLEHAKSFPNLHAIGVFDKDRLIGFSSFDTVNGIYGVSSFQKADRNYDDIYSYLTREAAKMMVKMGCKYINFEQDLGIEGLRSSKLSWHPVRFLKKYTVSPR